MKNGDHHSEMMPLPVDVLMQKSPVGIGLIVNQKCSEMAAMGPKIIKISLFDSRLKKWNLGPKMHKIKKFCHVEPKYFFILFIFFLSCKFWPPGAKTVSSHMW